MIRLSTLLKATPPEIVNRAIKQCKVRVTRAIHDVDENGYHKMVMATIVATGDKRFTVMKFYEPEKADLINSTAWVHCSCEYHKFVLEVANTLRDASSIIDSNGNFPHITNPSARPHLCKHLVAMIKYAIDAKAKELKDVGDVSKKDVELMLRQLSPYIRDRNKQGASSPNKKQPNAGKEMDNLIQKTIRSFK